MEGDHHRPRLLPPVPHAHPRTGSEHGRGPNKDPDRLEAPSPPDSSVSTRLPTVTWVDESRSSLAAGLYRSALPRAVRTGLRDGTQRQLRVAREQRHAFAPRPRVPRTRRFRRRIGARQKRAPVAGCPCPRRGVLQERCRFGAAAQRSERLEIPRFRGHSWNAVSVWRGIADD